VRPKLRCIVGKLPGYENHQSRPGPNRKFTWRLFEGFGSYYNGHLNEARVRWSYRASEHLSLDFSEHWNRFRLPQGNFSVVFGSIQTNYAFSRFLFLSTLLQMDTANTQAASANIRSRWNYRPDGDLVDLHRRSALRFVSRCQLNAAHGAPFAVKFTFRFAK
jgi:hypothetical protein